MASGDSSPELEGGVGVFDLATLVTGLDAVPGAELDPFLDAASRCFARHGLRRTSVQDVARELGVDRTTVYRQVGTVPQQARLLAARELQRMVASIPSRAPQPVGPTGVIEIMASVIEEVRSHPVIAKLLADDTDTITLSTLSELPPLLERVAAGLAPMLTAAMSAGELAPRDPTILAEWLIRLVVTLVLVPPKAELRTFLSELLCPPSLPRYNSSTKVLQCGSLGVWRELGPAAIQRQIRGAGLDLAVTERGNPSHPTVLLLHGFPDTSAVWEPLALLLAQRLHVVTYDVRGAGNSDIPSQRSDYALSFLVEDLAAVADAVSPGTPVHLVAHDWGSIQGWEAVTEDRLAGRFASYTSISGPPLDHASLWARKHRTTRPSDIRLTILQALHSWYIVFFHLPYLPQAMGPSASRRLWSRALHRIEGTPSDEIGPHPRSALTSPMASISTGPMSCPACDTRWRATPRRQCRSSSP